ncbi:hypothetical protein [Egibacter rhizosphaerae]|uniref:hypothetical protein n=1 Tax=Egibacter rhizosphaerae TaxID=1670831 RepID=UPI001F0E4762|nr:hypothetical protein [Egibacter rhizosphaerae]
MVLHATSRAGAAAAAPASTSGRGSYPPPAKRNTTSSGCGVVSPSAETIASVAAAAGSAAELWPVREDRRGLVSVIASPVGIVSPVLVDCGLF